MNPTIGVAATFRNEHNALPGFLEMASLFFDDVFLADCSMDMTPSTDGSLDIIRKWGLPDPPLWNLSNGFGAVRSQLLNSSRTDWTVILDIDERMWPVQQDMICHGSDRFPAVPDPKLRVERMATTYDHRALLLAKIAWAESKGIRAVRFSRRHWFDMGMKRPCENWNVIKDYQLRCMKSNAGMGYTVEPKMHEKAFDFNTKQEPQYIDDDPLRGPFIDHFHCWFKVMEPEQRSEDILAYDQLKKSESHTPLAQ